MPRPSRRPKRHANPPLHINARNEMRAAYKRLDAASAALGKAQEELLAAARDVAMGARLLDGAQVLPSALFDARVLAKRLSRLANGATLPNLDGQIAEFHGDLVNLAESL